MGILKPMLAACLLCAGASSAIAAETSGTKYYDLVPTAQAHKVIEFIYVTVDFSYDMAASATLDPELCRDATWDCGYYEQGTAFIGLSPSGSDPYFDRVGSGFQMAVGPEPYLYEISKSFSGTYGFTIDVRGTAFSFSVGSLPVELTYDASAFIANYSGPPGLVTNEIGHTNISAAISGYSFEYADAAPEPASWAMMLTGFGMIGAALRARGKPSASFQLR